MFGRRAGLNTGKAPIDPLASPPKSDDEDEKKDADVPDDMAWLKDDDGPIVTAKKSPPKATFGRRAASASEPSSTGFGFPAPAPKPSSTPTVKSVVTNVSKPQTPQERSPVKPTPSAPLPITASGQSSAVGTQPHLQQGAETQRPGLAPPHGVSNQQGAFAMTDSPKKELPTSTVQPKSEGHPLSTGTVLPQSETQASAAIPQLATAAELELLKTQINQLESEEDAVRQAYDELLTSPIHSMQPGVSSETSSKEEQLSAARRALEEVRLEALRRRETTHAQHKAADARTEEDLTRDIATESQQRTKQLTSEEEQLMVQVRELKARQNQELDKVSGSDASEVKDSSARLMALLIPRLQSWRSNSESKVQNFIREEVKRCLVEASTTREQLALRDREDRTAAFQRYREQRFASFDEFRKQRREQRHHACDAFWGSLKATRERRNSERDVEMQKLRRQHEAQLETDAVNARKETRILMERILEQRRAAIADENEQGERRIAALEAQNTIDRQHARKLHKGEKESLTRRLQIELEGLSNVVKGTQRADAGQVNWAGDLSARSKALEGKLTALHSQTLQSVKAIELSTKLPSANRQVMQAQSARVEELRARIMAADETLQKEWSRLDRMLRDLDAQANNASNSFVDSRAGVRRLQQDIDTQRNSWEKEHRKQLCAASIPTAQSVLTDVVIEMGSKLRHFTQRSKEVRGTRGKISAKHFAFDEEVFGKSDEVIKHMSNIMARYDELASATASLEIRTKHLDAEQGDQDVARAMLEKEHQDFGEMAAKLESWSDGIKKDSSETGKNYRAALARQQMQAAASYGTLMPVNQNVQFGRGGPFTNLDPSVAAKAKGTTMLLHDPFVSKIMRRSGSAAQQTRIPGATDGVSGMLSALGLSEMNTSAQHPPTNGRDDFSSLLPITSSESSSLALGQGGQQHHHHAHYPTHAVARGSSMGTSSSHQGTSSGRSGSSAGAHGAPGAVGSLTTPSADSEEPVHGGAGAL